jgi:D-alanyl-D-alanine carboxypeptidase/D-alanyl-D-alanine-endopeptidase (penicillin-binding protein 4)
MKHPPRLFLLLAISLFFAALAAGPAASRVGPDLASDVRAVLQEKALAKGEVGVAIARLSSSSPTPEVLFRHNSDIPLVPASNLKLITTSAFVDRFGADFKFRTTLAMRGDDLVVIGDADPSFGDAELLRRAGWESTTVFANWAEMLKKRGVKSVRNVLVDDSICDQTFVHPNWPAKQQHFRYVAGVAGMNFNANALDFYLRTTGHGNVVNYTIDPPTKYANISNDCVSGADNAVWLSRTPGTNNVELRGQASTSNTVAVSVSIHDPAMYAATVFSEVLEKNGINVTGAPLRDRTIRPMLAAKDASLNVLAIHETPLAAALHRANKDSMNLYAEAMCKRLGAEDSRESGSWENGTAAMSAFVKSCGVSEGEFNFDDGCGLSKKNGISANAIVRVLAHDFASKNRDVFMQSLSIAGVDGTLDNRFKDSDLRTRVMGKSGYINGVSALSGFVHAKDDRWYAFSILMNGIGDVATCKQLQERIVKAIDAHATSNTVSSAR